MLQIRLRDRWAPQGLRGGIIGAEVGPRGDGYKVESCMTADEAMAYHTPQMLALKECGVEMITCATMTHVSEALGVAMAAANAGLPLNLGATVETNGRLPDGTQLSEFVQQIDAALDSKGLTRPLFYMVNCAHPTHFDAVLDVDMGTEQGAWRKRIRAIRANASTKSHAELDESEEVDNGDIDALGQTLAMWHKDRGIAIVGGCCGTDARHIESIVKHVSTQG
jgi:homocysteine S-methyltransferase